MAQQVLITFAFDLTEKRKRAAWEKFTELAVRWCTPKALLNPLCCSYTESAGPCRDVVNSAHGRVSFFDAIDADTDFAMKREGVNNAITAMMMIYESKDDAHPIAKALDELAAVHGRKALVPYLYGRMAHLLTNHGDYTIGGATFVPLSMGGMIQRATLAHLSEPKWEDRNGEHMPTVGGMQ